MDMIFTLLDGPFENHCAPLWPTLQTKRCTCTYNVAPPPLPRATHQYLEHKHKTTDYTDYTVEDKVKYPQSPDHQPFTRLYGG